MLAIQNSKATKCLHFLLECQPMFWVNNCSIICGEGPQLSTVLSRDSNEMLQVIWKFLTYWYLKDYQDQVLQVAINALHCSDFRGQVYLKLLKILHMFDCMQRVVDYEYTIHNVYYTCVVNIMDSTFQHNFTCYLLLRETVVKCNLNNIIEILLLGKFFEISNNNYICQCHGHDQVISDRKLINSTLVII